MKNQLHYLTDKSSNCVIFLTNFYCMTNKISEASVEELRIVTIF